MEIFKWRNKISYIKFSLDNVNSILITKEKGSEDEGRAIKICNFKKRERKKFLKYLAPESCGTLPKGLIVVNRVPQNRRKKYLKKER
jgi:hypothetical protein